MSLPATSEGLASAGFKFIDFGTCKKCGSDVEWYFTGSGARMPIDPMPRGSSPVVKHFETCTG